MQTRASPSVQTLHRLAHQASIDGYEKMSKSSIFSKLQDQFNIDRLQRAEARRNKFSVIQENKKRKLEEKAKDSASREEEQVKLTPKKRVKLNTTDPIMFTPIDKKNSFKFCRPNGAVVRFNIASLVDFLLSTGDFTDPETRLPFSDDDLREIDDIAKQANLKKSSVLAAKKDVNRYSDAKFRRDAILGLERCAGEVVVDMLEVVETQDPDEAQMQLVMREFPTFQEYFRQIREAEPAYASKCISHWRQFVQGPPNRPNHDEVGLIRVVCNFLRSCDNGTA